jgi:5-methylcytosine-specific restriction protein A
VNWEQSKRAVEARDGGKCLKCLGEATDVHHRLVKGMGGTKRAEVHGLANLVCLCRSCHNHIHSHPEESYALGFLVRSGYNPADVPVRVLQRGRLKLNDDGSTGREPEYAWF